MPDALTSVSALAAPGLSSERNLTTESQRSIRSRDNGIPEFEPVSPHFPADTIDSTSAVRLDASLEAGSNSEVDELLAGFSVHVTLAAFVMARDEIRRQNEQIISRLNEARDEP